MLNLKFYPSRSQSQVIDTKFLAFGARWMKRF